MTHTFKAQYDQYLERDGQPFEIIRKVTKPEATIDWEVLPMYEIRFLNDGYVTMAWPEEVEP